MSDSRCIIVGASHAGVSLALSLRKQGWEGGITLVGAENELPYQRPPLSKTYLSGEKRVTGIRLRPEKAYADANIELRLGTPVSSIDRNSKQLLLENGESLSYTKLALCTGASVRRLPFGGDLEQVHYLRTTADADPIKAQAMRARSAVIVGAGYIGLETAAMLSSMGIDVTVLEMAERILSRVSGQVVADYLSTLHWRYGVTIKTATQVKAIELDTVAGHDKVTVTCSDNSEVTADFVVIGAGIEPNAALAEAAGLEVDNGIVVNEFTQTSDPDIFAAGDCTSHPSTLYQRRIRLESVQNATDQARIAASNICGKQKVYNSVPWFWSEQYDTKLQIAGVSEGYDDYLVRGNPGRGGNGFAVYYFSAGRLIAVDSIRSYRDFLAAKLLLAKRIEVPRKVLEDPSSDPTSWVR